MYRMNYCTTPSGSGVGVSLSIGGNSVRNIKVFNMVDKALSGELSSLHTGFVINNSQFSKRFLAYIVCPHSCGNVFVSLMSQ